MNRTSQLNRDGVERPVGKWIRGARTMVLITALALLAAFPAAAEEWQRVASGDAKVSVGVGWAKATAGSLWVKWAPN